MKSFLPKLILVTILTAASIAASAQTSPAERYSVVPDAQGGVWIFDSILGAVSKCVRPEPRPQDGNQPRLANPFEFYTDGNSVPHCSDWTTLSEDTGE